MLTTVSALLGALCSLKQQQLVTLFLVQDTTVNLFETTIRILGGLMSAFYLSGGDRVYLYKAVELGMRMTPGFHSPSGERKMGKETKCNRQLLPVFVRIIASRFSDHDPVTCHSL